MAFQYLKRIFKKAGEGLWTISCSARTRGTCFKLKDDGFRVGIMKKFIILRIARHWNSLSREVVDAPVSHPWKCLRPAWMELWATWSYGSCPWPWRRGWNCVIFKVPFKLKHSMILVFPTMRYLNSVQGPAAASALWKKGKRWRGGDCWWRTTPFYHWLFITDTETQYLTLFFDSHTDSSHIR